MSIEVWSVSRRGALRLAVGAAASARVALAAMGALTTPAVWGTAVDAWHVRRRLFGSDADLVLPGAGSTAGIEAAAAEVFAGLEAMNTRWNAWKPGEVTTLNAAFRAGRSARVSPALRRLIEGAARLEAASGGTFNAGIGGLVGAWGFHADRLAPGPRPRAERLRELIEARPGLSQLRFSGDEVSSRNPLLQLDFGGYAKGVAIEWAFERLRRRGVHDALLNLGGNLATMGVRQQRPWRVGIRDPFGDGLLATLDTRGREAVVTSGSYERWRELDGERVTHIIDPARGVPADELVSVTVVHGDAGVADAAATALLVAGRQRWPAVARGLGVNQVLVIDRHGHCQATPALRPRLRPVA